MALLARNLQVHPGLIHAAVELLLVARRPLTAEEVQQCLQPGTLAQVVESPLPDVVGLTLDALEWLGLAASADETWVLSDDVNQLDVASLDRALPRYVRRGLFNRDWPHDLSTAQRRGGDVGIATAWYLAQDAWSPPARFENLPDSIERALASQFAEPRDYINETKWAAVRRWLQYFGLGVPDPIDPDMMIPDPTAAVRDELCDLEGTEWPIDELVSVLADRCGALDLGAARAVALKGAKRDALPWEHDTAVLSPSLSMALLRLEFEGSLELLRAADSAPARRRSLTTPAEERVVDQVRLTEVAQ